MQTPKVPTTHNHMGWAVFNLDNGELEYFTFNSRQEAREYKNSNEGNLSSPRRVSARFTINS